LELTLFEKIERHFLAKLPSEPGSVITDVKKAVNTLNALCIEIDLRFDLLKDAQVRRLKEYNQKFIDREIGNPDMHRFLPYIVVVIDEFADLIKWDKSVESLIARIAQQGRPVGVHLVISTQRPSVNIITGIIKANFPSRLAFRVSSAIDSRAILDDIGADQLKGHGDRSTYTCIRPPKEKQPLFSLKDKVIYELLFKQTYDLSPSSPNRTGRVLDSKNSRIPGNGLAHGQTAVKPDRAGIPARTGKDTRKEKVTGNLRAVCQRRNNPACFGGA
jgi:hypothetical protein